MGNENKYKTLFFALLCILVFVWLKYNKLKEENVILVNREMFLANQVDEYRYTIDQANENIENANSIIEDAQGYAWSTYEEMGYALDNLTTVDTVQEP